MAADGTGVSAIPEDLAAQLNAILHADGQAVLQPEAALRFGSYGALLLKWNARMNLTAVRDVEGILRRHFAESIRCVRALPGGIRTLLDLGSGAGFPGIPIALCRPEIEVTLAESQTKKAAFLREAARRLALTAHVHAGRAETLGQRFECVTLRAVDKMAGAVRVGAELVMPGGWLALLTTGTEADGLKALAGGFDWSLAPAAIGGAERILVLGRRV